MKPRLEGETFDLLFEGYYEAASELLETSKSFDGIENNDHELKMLEDYTQGMRGKAYE